MELNEDESQTLRLRVDRISSELDKQNAVRAVNTKWMIIVGAVILAALGFTSFVQLPREADRAAREQVGPEIIEKANRILSDLQRKAAYAKGMKKELGEISELQKIANLPIGTIIPSMLDPSSFAKTVGDPDPPDFDSAKSNWVLADHQTNIKGSQYANLLGKNLTPDLRGMFLRGMNEGRNDGEQDPDDRKPGDYQADALQRHGHKTTATVRDWNRQKEGQAGYTSKATNAAPASVTDVTGEKVNVENETRPKNVAVYFYIKIN